MKLTDKAITEALKDGKYIRISGWPEACVRLHSKSQVLENGWLADGKYETCGTYKDTYAISFEELCSDDWEIV